MNTKAEVLAYIVAQILDAIAGNISPSKLRSVLNYMVDREYQPSEIPVSKAGFTSTNLDGLLDEIIDALGSSTMTGAEIVAQLEALTGADKLNYAAIKDVPDASDIRTLIESLTSNNRVVKTSIRGADFALNHRGKGDIYNGTFNTGMNHILAGDFWIYDTGGAGGSDELSEGDWVVALRAGASTLDFTNTDDWMVLEFSQLGGTMTALQIVALIETLSGTSLLDGSKVKYSNAKTIIEQLDDLIPTGGSVKALLETLSGTEMLEANKVHYGGGVSVKAKIDELRVGLFHKRNIATASGQTVTFTGSLYPHNLGVNHLTYFGKEDDGSFGDYDFIWEHTGGNTLITINPAVIDDFEVGTVIDLIYTT